MEREIKKLSAELRIISGKIEALEHRNDEENSKIDVYAPQVQFLKTEIDNAQTEINLKVQEKISNFQEMLNLQHLLKQYQNVQNKQYKWQIKDPIKRTAELEQIEKRILDIEAALSKSR